MKIQSTERLKILCFGAGAIGTYLAGSLALQGHKITLLEKAESAGDLLNQGLRLSIDGKVVCAPLHGLAATLHDAIRLGPYDAGFIAVKGYDTLELAKNLAVERDNLPVMVCFQNGIGHETVYREYLGSDKAIAATVTSAVGRIGFGDIILEKKRGVGLAGSNALSMILVNEFNFAGIKARLFPDENSMKWSKLLTNLPANATSAILDMTPSEIYADPLASKLDIKQIQEAIAVMRAMGISITNLPDTPVRTMAWLYTHAKWPGTRLLLQKGIGGGRGAKMPSFHIDLHSGRGVSEIEYLNGSVVRYGDACGVPTPVNRMFHEILTKLVKGEVKKDTYSRLPQKLVSILPQFDR